MVKVDLGQVGEVLGHMGDLAHHSKRALAHGPEVANKDKSFGQRAEHAAEATAAVATVFIVGRRLWQAFNPQTPPKEE